MDFYDDRNIFDQIKLKLYLEPKFMMNVIKNDAITKYGRSEFEKHFPYKAIVSACKERLGENLYLDHFLISSNDLISIVCG
jgi:hypothetical protein